MSTLVLTWPLGRVSGGPSKRELADQERFRKRNKDSNRGQVGFVNPPKTKRKKKGRRKRD